MAVRPKETILTGTSRRNQSLLTDEGVLARLPELWKALDEFNDGYWFESHETLEELWFVSPWPVRQFFQGIIQAAAAFVHLARREREGTLKLLPLAIAKLEPFAPEHLGIDVGRLVADLRRARDDIASLPAEALDGYRECAPRIAFERVVPSTGHRDDLTPAARADARPRPR